MYGLNFTVLDNPECNIHEMSLDNPHYDTIGIFLLFTYSLRFTLEKNIIISCFSNSALESFRLKFKVNSKDNEPLCNVLCKYVYTYILYVYFRLFES